MEANAFISEVYRRVALRYPPAEYSVGWEVVKDKPQVLETASEIAPLLPANKDASILDIGFGSGYFMAACARLGYTNISGAEFGVSTRGELLKWPGVVALQEVETNIGDLLANQAERFDFIHLAHVIEHIPKYSLLYIADALYHALRPDGTLMLRTPNMESPCANSSLFVTLGHEYGFCGANLEMLLSICNFDDVRLHDLKIYNPSVKQRIGQLLRWPTLKMTAFRHRLFGVNYGGKYDREIVITGKRRSRPPFFDPQYR